jgi:hypothetical protein
MEGIADFFGDPLVWPAGVYFLAYTFVWIIAFGLGQSLKHRVSIERAAAFAWGIALFIHILGGTALIIWLWDRVNNRFAELMYTTLYLLFYIVIMLVDVCLLFSLLTKNRKQKNIDAPTPKLARKSLNPKKKS